ncbi:hypothetical protein EJ110_NYTH05512 [Nymphaea thermarum]|nr:hypothetical protein EJ110_NYTH05512 [Nymphaea thermarum]
MTTHCLRLALSCRKISAVVVRAGTDSIVAMADSMEAEFLPQYRVNENRVPRCKSFWDLKVASKVGDNLGSRLSGISVSHVEVDADEEASRPLHYRRSVAPFFDSLQRRGIRVHGLQCSPPETAATTTVKQEKF